MNIIRPRDFFADITPAEAMTHRARSQFYRAGEKLEFSLLNSRVSPTSSSSRAVFEGAGSLTHREQLHLLCALTFVAEEQGWRFNVIYRRGMHRIFMKKL